jgi:hypothetical protein
MSTVNEMVMCEDEQAEPGTQKRLGHVIPFGYRVPEAIVRLSELMLRPNTILVDVRKRPQARRDPTFNKKRLAQRWCMRYTWLGETLGNKLYQSQNEGDIELENPKRGIPILLQVLRTGTSTVLLCGCPEYEQCHIKEIVRLLHLEEPALVIEKLSLLTE